MEKQDIKIYLFVFILIILSTLVVRVWYDKITSEEIYVHFDDRLMGDLNRLYVNTTSPWEFVAYLYGNQDNITRLGMLGYHNAVNNEVILVYEDNIDFSEISIHSHPKINHLPGICILSGIDRTSTEKVMCVMCGVNKIRCYLNDKK